MTARFWVPIGDGFVRLKLTEGRPLQWWREWATEEGWAAEGERWRLEGDTVIRESHTDGRDCDGRLATYSVAACRVDRLDGWPFTDSHGCTPLPLWELVDNRQRDYAAEAAGY